MKKYKNIEMNKDLYDREYCLVLAEKIVENGEISGMSVEEIAMEIYAHAYIYYNFDKAPEWVRKSEFGESMYESVKNGVDLEDGGDKALRKIFFQTVWELMD